MKRNIRIITAVLLGLLLSIMLPMPAVLAANIKSIQLPVTINVRGAVPDTPEVYVVRITANHTYNPMPNGQYGGSYDLLINGPGDSVFPPIEFESVGLYYYTIEQIPGKTPNCRYDSQIYIVKITVTTSKTGKLYISVSLHEPNMDAKPGEIEFNNEYQYVGKPPLPPESDYPPVPDNPPDSEYPPVSDDPSVPDKPPVSDDPSVPDNPPDSDEPPVSDEPFIPDDSADSETPPDDDIVPTGVADRWLLYLTGSAVLLLISGFIIRRLFRKEDE